MPEPGATGQRLSDDELGAIEAVAAFHAQHQSQAGRLQTRINRLTARLGRPSTFIALLLVLAAWLAVPTLLGLGIDSPLFTWLELGATLAALLVALLILVTQRHEDELAQRRAQLTLELALLADRKNAKIIALLEELRRDAPGLSDRKDAESEAMAQPADLEAVAAASDATHAPP